MRVLVAGGSGALGRHVVAQLVGQGHVVRLLTRRAGTTSLQRVEVVEADALKPGALEGTATGCDAVFSCLGASVDPMAPGRAGYPSVDTPANLALIAEAKRAGVKRFVYVSVFHVPEMAQLAYVKAHEDVVHALETSGLDFGVVRPTGFHSAFALMVPMAKKGPLPQVGDGRATSNPIADEDLATVCVETLLGTAREVPCGGPEVHSRAEVNAVVAKAAGVPLRTRAVPPWVMSTVAGLARPFHPRAAQFLAFLVAISRLDLVAPKRGRRTLEASLTARTAAAP